MYYHHLETSAKAKAQHDAGLRDAATKRLIANAQKKAKPAVASAQAIITAA